MPALTYVKGDATKPITRPAIVAHVCNDRGGWGAGFVLAVTENLGPKPEACYRAWAMTNFYDESQLFGMGEVQFVPVEYDGNGCHSLLVANMVAQSGYRSESNPTPIRYAALERCLNLVDDQAVDMHCAIHVPRIGCGLAGGTWDSVSALLRALRSPVIVYDLP